MRPYRVYFRRHSHRFRKAAPAFRHDRLIRNGRRIQIVNGKLSRNITNHSRKKLCLLSGERKDGIHRIAIDPIV